MLREFSRHRRRVLGVSRATAGGALLFLGIYALIAFLVWRFHESFSPLILILVQTCLFMLFIPLLVHNAIAGEREKRTWEMLRVAPLTRAQIILGKFIASVGLLLGFIGAFFLLVAILTFTYQPGGTRLFVPSLWAEVLIAEAISTTFGILVVALTLTASSISHRAFTALSLSIGILFVWMLLGPMIGSMLDSGALSETFNYLHPIDLQLLHMNRVEPSYDPSFFFTFAHFAAVLSAYLLLTTLLLALSTKLLKIIDRN